MGHPGALRIDYGKVAYWVRDAVACLDSSAQITSVETGATKALLLQQALQKFGLA